MERKELRDHFAAEVMNALITGSPKPTDVVALAQLAFDIADAMLQQSDRPVPQPPEISDPNHFVAPGN